jgi:predicted secreted protein
MEQKTEAEGAAEKANEQARAKAEAKRHMIFGIVAAAVIVGLIALMFAIEDYGLSRMPNAELQQPHDAAER